MPCRRTRRRERSVVGFSDSFASAGSLITACTPKHYRITIFRTKPEKRFATTLVGRFSRRPVSKRTAKISASTKIDCRPRVLGEPFVTDFEYRRRPYYIGLSFKKTVAREYSSGGAMIAETKNRKIRENNGRGADVCLVLFAAFSPANHRRGERCKQRAFFGERVYRFPTIRSFEN